MGRDGSGWRTLLPGLGELRSQAPAAWRSDLIAGVSVAAIAVPAALGMAELAGLPPSAGLYATMFPLVAYALIGSSRKLIVGPDGALSALTASTVGPIAAGSASSYPELAAMLALLTGLVMLAAAGLRLGFMADFLSKPVLIGYFNGVALSIIAGQAGKLIGVKTTSNRFFAELWQLITHLGEASLATTGLSAGLIIMALLLKRFVPKAPAALFVIVVGAALSAGLNLSTHGVATIGHVPGGIPLPGVPHVGIGQISTLLIAAVGMALVSFGDVIATTRTYAARDGYKISPSRELAGLGAANVVAAVTHSQPVSSSGSRTAANDAVGGRTQLVGLTVASLTLVVALVATPLLADVPKAALGVVLVLAAVGMISVHSVARLRRVHNAEVAIALATMLAVLVFGVLGGLLIAVGLSIGVFVYRSVRPHDAVLGLAEDAIDGWHDVEHTANTQTVPGLLVYRFDAPLYFPNAPYFKARVLNALETSDPPVTRLLLNFEAVTYVDATAEQTLRELHDELTARGVALHLARVKWHVRRSLDDSGFTAALGADHYHGSTGAGIRAMTGDTADPGQVP